MFKDWSYLRTHLKLSENFKGKISMTKVYDLLVQAIEYVMNCVDPMLVMYVIFGVVVGAVCF